MKNAVVLVEQENVRKENCFLNGKPILEEGAVLACLTGKGIIKLENSGQEEAIVQRGIEGLYREKEEEVDITLEIGAGVMELEHILDIQIEKKINEHATLRLTGLLSEDAQEEKIYQKV